MDPNALRDHLTQLRAELGATPRVDPGSRRLLGEIMEDIQRLLARSPEQQHDPVPPIVAKPAGVDEADSPLPDRLEKIALLFEVDHPTLAASSRRLVDLLGKIGL